MNSHLEERKLCRVRRCGLVQCVQLFDNNVRVTDNLSLTVELLGRGEVVLLSIDEVAGFHVLDRHRDGKGLIGGDGVTIFGVLELGRWHVARGRDGTDGRGVA